MIKAEIIADSLNEFGQRLTTFVLVFPRIVLAEFNTHRMLSRNSASSRAIPFKKMLKRVQDDPFIPIRWMKEHTGMQGTQYFTDSDDIKSLVSTHLAARDYATSFAELLSQAKVSKQICNRYLEPFMWHTVIVTGTDWENFFALRAHEAAEIHIQDLAFKMLDVYNESKPKMLKAGEWHIPFGDTLDSGRCRDWLMGCDDETFHSMGIGEMKRKIATARCARISYLNFEGNDDYGADVKLHDILLKSGHMSPFEHCARAMSEREFGDYINGFASEYAGAFKPVFPDDAKGWCGNFRGFIQYRKTIEGENKKDERVITHEKTI